MADVYKKVSDMLTITSFRDTDCIPIVSNGGNYKVSIATLAEVLGSSGGGISRISGEKHFTGTTKTMATLTFITEAIGE